MFYTKEKLRNRIGELKNLRYRDTTQIPMWRFKLDEEGEIGARPPEMTDAELVPLGYRWSGRDVYAWLEADVALPEDWDTRRVVGLFAFGKSGGGNASGFESLLYIDGEPYQGVDTNHGEVFFPREAMGTRLRLSFRLWSGLEGGGVPREREHTLEQGALAWLDEATDDLYFTGIAILQTLDVLPESSADGVDLLNALDEAVRLINFAYPGSDAFYASVESARDCLAEKLSNLSKDSQVTIRCIGHTHIDVAYLWRLRHTREKSARSFTTALRLMEMFPEFTFLQTQPQLYDYIKTDYPDIYEAIRTRVDEGRWEADGAMWLEADCNLTSGESLVRQILFGTRFFEREFGRTCKYLWLPDVFGYSSALPQILRKSGIEMFMTTKISWNQYNRMPHDTFIWRGLDGSEIVTHFITTPDPKPHGWFYTYNGQVSASTVTGSWEAYRDKRVNRELLLAYGYGDGGGGVTRDMLELRRRLDALPGLPRVATGRADEYFNRLLQTIRESKEYVHTWDGELYLEYQSEITQRLVLYADSPRMDFETEVDWHEHHQLLKVAFPIDVRATSATYDIQFGNTKRPTHWNTSWDLARFESVGHQWADCPRTATAQALPTTASTGTTSRMEFCACRSLNPQPIRIQKRTSVTTTSHTRSSRTREISCRLVWSARHISRVGCM